MYTSLLVHAYMAGCTTFKSAFVIDAYTLNLLCTVPHQKPMAQRSEISISLVLNDSLLGCVVLSNGHLKGQECVSTAGRQFYCICAHLPSREKIWDIQTRLT